MLLLKAFSRLSLCFVLWCWLLIFCPGDSTVFMVLGSEACGCGHIGSCTFPSLERNCILTEQYGPLQHREFSEIFLCVRFPGQVSNVKYIKATVSHIPLYPLPDLGSPLFICRDHACIGFSTRDVLGAFLLRILSAFPPSASHPWSYPILLWPPQLSLCMASASGLHQGSVLAFLFPLHSKWISLGWSSLGGTVV